MNSLPRIVTVTPSRVSFTSAALQGLEAVDHGFDACAGVTGFLHQARVLFAQVVLIRLERLVFVFQAPASLDEFVDATDRKSTRLNSSHGYISYAVFCLKKKN